MTEMIVHGIVFGSVSIVMGILWFALGWEMCRRFHGIEVEDE